MVGETIKNILEAEAKADGILRDADAAVRKIEAKAQGTEENLKSSHIKLLSEVHKKLTDTTELQSQQFTTIKTEKARIDEAVKYIVANLLDGVKC